MSYNVQTVIVVDGVTWVDTEGTDRRRVIRRREDRERLAARIAHYTRP